MIKEEKKKEKYTYREIEDESVKRTPYAMTRGEYIVWLLDGFEGVKWKDKRVL